MIIKLNISGWEANVVTNYFLSFQASNDTRNTPREIDLQIASFVIFLGSPEVNEMSLIKLCERGEIMMNY